MVGQATELSGYPRYMAEAVGEHPAESESFSFGPFSTFPAARALTCNGQQVHLGSRAFDILIVLLRSQGQIVAREEIVRQVWPSTTVDGSNLRIQITKLRKALGDERHRIKTIPGRGYLFVGDQGKGETAAIPLFDSIDQLEHPQSVRKAAIVIIDENPDNREALHRLLRPFDAYVHSFSSIEAFLASGSGLNRAGLLQ